MTQKMRRTLWSGGFLTLVCAVLGLGVWWYLESSRPIGLQAATDETPPAKDENKYSLSEADKEFLWDVEHHGNVLSTHGFKVIAKALRDRDEKTLIKVLATDFVGQVPDKVEELKAQ